MKYALLVAWREYAENAKTKGFWIGLLLFPLMILGMTNVPIFLEKKATPTRHFVLVDQSGQFERVVEASLHQAHQQRVFNALRAYAAKHATPATNRAELARSLETFLAQGGQDAFLARLQPLLLPDAPPFQEPRQLFRRVPLPADVPARGDLPALSQALKPYLRGAQKIEVEGQPAPLHAAILIPPDLERHIVRPDRPRGAGEAAPANIEYWSANLADTALRDEIERSIDAEIRRREYVARGLDMATAQAIEATHAPFASLNPRKEEGRETVNTADLIRQWAPSAFVYLLWVAIFSISQMLLSNTIEEKSNRIIEVLLSSVTPGELMTGKLIGIAGVGLTMVGAWVLSLVAILTWKSGTGSELSTQAFSVIRTSPLLPAFGFYFVFGYLMYAAIIMALGSLCNTLKEAQNFMGVIILFMMVPLMTMMYIPKDPNGTLATVLSWIPLYTPFVMMNRATADPPLFDLIGTMILMVVSAGGALWLSARIFRIGILRTGQPPKLRELLRWLKG